MKCHLKKDSNGVYDYTEANRFDYPSIGQIIDVINQKEILIIFAVTEDQQLTYNELKKLLPHASVGELRRNSTNVEEIVTQEYKKLSQRVSLQYPPTLKEKGIEVTVKAGLSCF